MNTSELLIKHQQNTWNTLRVRDSLESTVHSIFPALVVIWRKKYETCHTVRESPYQGHLQINVLLDPL